MIRSLLSAVIGSTCLLAASTACSRDSAPSPEDIARAIQQEAGAYVKTGKTDALSIAVVYEGKTQYFNFGTTARGKQQTPSQDTVYEIGSVSKTFTGLLLAHALVDHKAKASDDIRRYMQGAYPNLELKGTPITLSNLVTTTSGLPDNLPDIMGVFKTAGPAKAPFIVIDMLGHYSTKTLLEDLHKVALESQPGSTPKHSNVATELLGSLLEKIDGRPYDEQLATRIEKPLGMKSGLSKDRLPQMATGYSDDGTVMPLLLAPVVRAAGGLRYSSSDMARYVSAQLDVSDPAIQLTHQPALGDPDSQAIGFHWTISKTVDGNAHLSHGGGTFGFSSYVDMYPDAHYGMGQVARHRRTGACPGRARLSACGWHRETRAAALSQTASDRGLHQQLGIPVAEGWAHEGRGRHPGIQHRQPSAERKCFRQSRRSLPRGGRPRTIGGQLSALAAAQPRQHACKGSAG
ncbi:serine hydrolase domain-containing protein [Dyella silvatica]|uniref:serine hydrolase domain-containing protein n=1 Tax=Dyella silvatica TaxID=2992128 RepID=UPI0022566170|nr:serine hydrolase [Dyella silvatica]